MRRLLVAGWLVMPVAAWAYHEGPGQVGLQLDRADAALVEARRAASQEDWIAAVERYEVALQELPAERVAEGRAIRLAIAKGKLESERLIEAREELAGLVDELESDADVDTAMLDEAREAYANAQYYVTWLMRLEGYPREEWEPEIEIARQTYRLLAERADDAGLSRKAQDRRADLESAVKLARLDLQELQALPLPST